MGEQVIDLEGLACHKGSSFGSLGQAPQPSIEQFENTLAFELKQYDLTKRIWIENESRKIGKVALSEGFWNQMLHAEIIAIQIPVSSRLDRLVNEYGSFSKVELQDALERIGKRLGPQHLKHALELLEEGNIRAVAEASLAYYDKAYAHGLQNRREHAPEVLSFDSFNPTAIATSLLDWTKTKNS
jgi:tRNA 2-selenouridine synthase